MLYSVLNSYYVVLSEDGSKSLSDTIKVGAFAANKQVTISAEDSLSDIPFSSLLTLPRTSTITTTQVSNTAQNNSGATTALGDTNNGNEKAANENTTPKCNSRNGSRGSSSSTTSGNDGFIMVELVTIWFTLTQVMTLHSLLAIMRVS